MLKDICWLGRIPNFGSRLLIDNYISLNDTSTRENIVYMNPSESNIVILPYTNTISFYLMLKMICSILCIFELKEISVGSPKLFN